MSYYISNSDYLQRANERNRNRNKGKQVIAITFLTTMKFTRN